MLSTILTVHRRVSIATACSWCLLFSSAGEAQKSAATLVDRTVAVVENDLITENELRMQVGNTLASLRQQNQQDINQRELVIQVLQQMILQKLQLQEAERLGIRVDEETLERVLENIAQRNRLSLSEIKEKVESEGGDYNQFRENIKNEIAITRLVNQEVIDKIEVSEQEIEDYLEAQGHYRNRRWRLAYLHWPAAADSATLQEQLLAVYKTMRAEEIASPRRLEKLFEQKWRALYGKEVALPNYQTHTVYWRQHQFPPSQQARVQRMKAERSGWLTSNSQGVFVFRLLAVEGSTDQIIQTQFLSRHILLTPTPLDEDQQLKKKLAMIKKKIEKGGSFAEYARRYSKDPGSAFKGGQMDWLSADQVVPEFAQALTVGKNRGGLVGPFKTQYGWHLVEVLDVREKNVTDSVLRNQAVSDIRKSKTEKERKEWLLQLRETRKVEIRL